MQCRVNGKQGKVKTMSALLNIEDHAKEKKNNFKKKKQHQSKEKKPGGFFKKAKLPHRIS